MPGPSLPAPSLAKDGLVERDKGGEVVVVGPFGGLQGLALQHASFVERPLRLQTMLSPGWAGG